MRTLKKVLALTLALATLFSLTAFAAYKDESKIDPDVMSAVNLVSSLKIMMGDENGFRPTDTIKRSEAAKMVYVLRTGGKTDADGWKGQNLFTDMKGHWAEGYVNYCASVGIIAGVGNKKFNPNGNVTGVELAKMLLVAAGYKADIQGYAGTQWANKVLADAESVGMFDGYDAAYMAAAPRQYAAQMFANALLRTNMAVYLSGELVTGIVANPVLVGTKYFGLEKKTGVPTITGDKAFTVDGKALTGFAINKDLRYQSVTVVFNGKTDEVYDVYASGKSKVYNVNFSDVTVKNPESGKYTVEMPGYAKTEYKAADALNYVRTTDVTTIVAKTIKDLYDLTDYNYNTATRFIDVDGNGTIDTMIVFNDEFVVVEKNNTTDGFVTSGKDVAKADYSKINFIDSVVKGDIVKQYVDMAGVHCVKKVEPVKGVFTAANAAGTSFTLGGVKYSFAENAYNKTAPTSFGTEYEVYTDGAYAVMIKEPSVTQSAFDANLCYVIDAVDKAGSLAGNQVAKVDVLLATGDRKVFEYSKNGTGHIANDAIVTNAKGKVMQYVITDGKISLKPVVDPDGVGTKFVINTLASAKAVTSVKSTQVFTFVDDSNVIARANADSYVFVKSVSNGEDKYAVVKASELNSITANATYKTVGYTSSNGANTLAYAYVEFTTGLPGGTSSDVYAIVTDSLSYEYNAEKKETQIIAPVMYLDGTTGKLVMNEIESGKVVVDNNNGDLGTEDKVAPSAVAKGIYKVTTTDGESRLALTKDADKYVASAKMSGFGDGFIVTASGYVNMAKDAKIIYLDATSKKVLTEDVELKVGLDVEYQLNSDSQITALVVYYK